MLKDPQNPGYPRSCAPQNEALRPQVGGAAPLAVALYQPDIPQNTGTILRMCACLGLDAAIIEPAGFPASDRHFRRAGMDYLDLVAVARHADWNAFESWRGLAKRRLVLLTTKADLAYTRFRFRSGDILLLGRESAGVPEAVHQAADARVVIPLRPPARSLNIAVAAAMAAGEALRQILSARDYATEPGSTPAPE